MTKKRPKILISKVPHLTYRGSQYQPDLLLAIQEGLPRVACLAEKSNIYKLIRTLEDVLEELKDLRWAQQQAKKTK
jgi:hypothetical protein